MVVDFPAPFGPRKPWISPASTVRSSPSRAMVRPNRFCRPRVLITVLMRVMLRPIHNFVNTANAS